MLELTFEESVTSQQRAWFNEGLSWMTWKKDRSTVSFKATVHTVADPPATGHNDYMATTITQYPDHAVVNFYIRTGADDVTNYPQEGENLKNFFMESAVHEYAHALGGVKVYGRYAPTDDPVMVALICPWFRHRISGAWGTPDDWETDTWAESIKEAFAEFFKDVFMPVDKRHYNNRTNWWVDQTMFLAYLEEMWSILCPDDPDEA